MRERETAADRKKAGVEEPAEYAHHQEPPQNPDGGLPIALRGAKRASSRKAAGSKRAASTRKK